MRGGRLNGVYGVEEPSWYRLLVDCFKPVYSIPRRGHGSGSIAHLPADGSVVEVRLACGEHRYEAGVAPSTYNGLVSQSPSSAPRAAALQACVRVLLLPAR